MSLAAACCHFRVHRSRHYLGLPQGFANHTGVNAEGATCLPSGFSQDGWGGASQSDTLDVLRISHTDAARYRADVLTGCCADIGTKHGWCYITEVSIEKKEW